MSPLWTSADAAAATGGRATRAFAATGVSIDTRTLCPGDLFVALTDLRDGHDFVRAALDKGAAAALVARIPAGCSAEDPLLLVPEVLPALAALGAASRVRTAAKVVAVTGSAGKTSTKEMLRAILAGQGRVHAAEASYNNHWGVPLTLARMPADSDFAVIEIGMNHPGEIAPLARLARPHVALVTTVAPAHLEAFDSIAAIAREKAEIVAGLEPGGTAVLNADLAVTPILVAAARAAGARVVTFGTSPGADWRLDEVRLVADRTVARATAGGRSFLFKLDGPGRHFAMNGIGALAAADVLGLDAGLALADLGSWRPPAGRGLRERIVLDPVMELSFDLIDDAFNANPASVEVALEVLAAAEPTDGVGRIAHGRRITILGDMLELGPDELAMHAAIATQPSIGRIDTVHCVGPRMRTLWEALPRPRRGEWRATADEFLPLLRHLVDAGDVLLVKGSKGIKVSRLVDAFRKLSQGGASEAARSE